MAWSANLSTILSCNGTWLPLCLCSSSNPPISPSHYNLLVANTPLRYMFSNRVSLPKISACSRGWHPELGPRFEHDYLCTNLVLLWWTTRVVFYYSIIQQITLYCHYQLKIALRKKMPQMMLRPGFHVNHFHHVSKNIFIIKPNILQKWYIQSTGLFCWRIKTMSACHAFGLMELQNKVVHILRQEFAI